MPIVVKSGTVIKAHGKTTIGRKARIAVDADIGKNVTNLSEGKSDGSKPSSGFVDASGKELSAYEAAVVEKTAAPATNVKTGETDYHTYNITTNNKEETKPSFTTIPSTQKQTVEETLKASSFQNRVNATVNKENEIRSSSGKFFTRTPDGKAAINFRAVFSKGYSNAEPVKAFTSTIKDPYSAGSYSSSAGERFASNVGGTIVASSGTLTGLGLINPLKAVRTAGTPIRSVGTAVVKGAPTGLKGVTGALYIAETSLAAGKIGYEVKKATLSSESKAFIKSGEARTAYEMANNQALAGKGKVSQYLISNIPGGKSMTNYDKKAFNSSVKEYAASKGYNERDFVTAVSDYGKARNIGTASAILTGNTASEAVGNALFSSNSAFSSGTSIPLKGSFKKLFVQGAKVTGTAGLGEGAGIALGMEASTGKKLSNYDYKLVAKSGVLGAVSAATLGGTIYATSILKPKLSKGLLGAAYATEPAEYFGDVAGGGSGVGVIKTPGSITFTNTLTDSKTSTDTRVNTNINTNTPTSVSSNVKVLTSGIFNPTNVNTAVGTNPFTNVNVRSNIFSSTNVPTNTNSFVNVPSNSQTQTNINVPTNTLVTSLVPTSTTTSKFPLFGITRTGGSNKGFKGGFGDFFKQSRSYNPSLTASVLNIKGGLPSDLGIKSGLAIRPII